MARIDALTGERYNIRGEGGGFGAGVAPKKPKKEQATTPGTTTPGTTTPGTTTPGVTTPGATTPGTTTPGTTAQKPVGGNGGGNGGAGAGGSQTPNITMPDVPDYTQQRQQLLDAMKDGIGEAKIDRVDYYDPQKLIDQLNQRADAAKQQTDATIDRAVDQQALDLQRALADAESQYATQQDAVTANEMAALDNAALYAEARGDRGGIGQGQYGSIQNTAAQNRLAVQQAQTKLSTDTMRQISDLRAQGEFDKADALLSLTQSYLSELSSIEKYAASHNLSVDQINTAIAEWEAEFANSAKQYQNSLEMSMANMTGQFSDGTPTYEAQNRTEQNTASLALTLIENGANPNQLSDAMKRALVSQYGMDAASLAAYTKLMKRSRGGGGGGGGGGDGDKLLDSILGGLTGTQETKDTTSPAAAKNGLWGAFKDQMNDYLKQDMMKTFS